MDSLAVVEDHLIDHLLIDARIDFLDLSHSAAAEADAEAPGRAFGAKLKHAHLVTGSRLLQQSREIQACGSSSNDSGLHAPLVPVMRIVSRPYSATVPPTPPLRQLYQTAGLKPAARRLKTR